jgi:hypothetical protein
VLLITIVVHAFWAASKPLTSDDLWWGMAAGRYIVEHGSVPSQDVLSYTNAGAPWTNGEWLSHVVEFELYQHTGGLGVAIFKIALVLVVFSLIAWMSWRRSRSLVITALVMVLAAHVCRPYFDIRSQLFLFLCTALVMAVLEAYRGGAPPWMLAVLPPIMVFWVNTHPSFLFGAGLLLLYAGAELAKTWLGLPDGPMPRRRALLLALAAVLAVLATLLNPYGFTALTDPFSVGGVDTPWRQLIIEWTPPVLFEDGDFNPAIFGYLLVGQVATALAACAWVRRRVDVGDALLFAATVALALSARRFVPLFTLVAAPFFAKNLALLRDRFLDSRSRALDGATSAGAAVLVLSAVGAIALVVVGTMPVAQMVRTRGLFDVLVGGDYFPASAVEFVRMNRMQGRLFHPYTWGGYLAFHLPDQQIFIDGRAHVYPLDFYRDAKLAEAGLPGWHQFLERWQVSVIVWPENAGFGTRDTAALQEFRVADDWVMVYADGHASVFAHAKRGRKWVDAFRQFTLAYPELPGAQLFMAIAHWNANSFSAAHRYFVAATNGSPAAQESAQKSERSFLSAAQTRESPRAWFNVGFFRELNGDRTGAAEAFSRALKSGLDQPNARDYAKAALERLASDK